MDKIKVFEAFAGIGAQHKALTNLKEKNKLDYEIVAISEWDMWANIAYEAIHFNEDKKYKYPSIEEMFKFLSNHEISKDSKTPITDRAFLNLKEEDLKALYKSYKRCKNIGSIVDVYDRYKEFKLIGKVDILTYSFPCQDLSNAGNFHGFNEGIKEGTRSGLLLEIEKLLKQLKKNDEDLPKVLLLENVSNLLSPSHVKSFEKWNKYLKKLGYSTIYGNINSKKYKCGQSRKRVFAISILNKDKNPEIKSNLEEEIDKIYDNFKPKKQYKNIGQILDLKSTNKKINYDIYQVKNTPSRHKYGRILEDHKAEFTPTVTTKQDRNPNTGLIIRKWNNNEYLGKRFLSVNECYKLMGFEDHDAYKVWDRFNSLGKRDSFKKEKMYRQAGNSISVQVLELIFEYIKRENIWKN